MEAVLRTMKSLGVSTCAAAASLSGPGAMEGMGTVEQVLALQK